MRARARDVLGAVDHLVAEVDGATFRDATAAVASYGGARPSTIAEIDGEWACGRGEHVGWTDAEHVAFRERTLPRVPRGLVRVADLRSALLHAEIPPYDRAAVEAAVIDLALRQAEVSLASLCRTRPGLVRYVVSFGRVADPGAEAARHPDVELKVDVDPSWGEDELDELAATGRVAVLDFKRGGDAALLARACRILPGALIEDPPGEPSSWPPGLASRLSFDAPLRSAADVRSLPAPPHAVNIKPARMGGVGEALACAAACQEGGIAVYLGGMFEIGVGRQQLRSLAGLLCPDAPNDIAPIAREGEAPERPGRLSVAPEEPGFAA